MALNVDSITLSEYRLTQNPIWQDVLANEIAREIFEDELFSPEEVIAVKDFMRYLEEDKQQHLTRIIRHYEVAEFKRQLLLNLAQKNRSAAAHWREDFHYEKMATPTSLMRGEFNELKGGKECVGYFNYYVRRHVETALIETVQSFYNSDYKPDVIGMFAWVNRSGVQFPIVSLDPEDKNILFNSGDGFRAEELCEELAAACPTFECEGLNDL